MKKRRKMIFRRCYSEFLSDNLDDLNKGNITLKDFFDVINAFLILVSYGFGDISQKEFLKKAEGLQIRQKQVLHATQCLIEDDKKDYSEICYEE